MVFHDLPKSGVFVVKAQDDSDVLGIVLGVFRAEKNVLIHQKYMESWLRDYYADVLTGKSTFCAYPEISNCDARNVIVTDFEVFAQDLGASCAARFLNRFREKYRVFLICHEEDGRRFSGILNAIINISRDGVKYLANSLVFDKKGRIGRQNDCIEFAEDGRISIWKRKKEEEENLSAKLEVGLDLEIKDTEKAARDALELPFIKSRQEDGVLIRDMSRKKIRAGGQIIYEPDAADDLDDSDPDDDLNI